MPRPVANRDDRQHPGTLTKPPTTVVNAAPDSGSYSAIAVMTASSKIARAAQCFGLVRLNGASHSFISP
jgi:hypothetical protein